MGTNVAADKCVELADTLAEFVARGAREFVTEIYDPRGGAARSAVELNLAILFAWVTTRKLCGAIPEPPARAVLDLMHLRLCERLGRSQEQVVPLMQDRYALYHSCVNDSNDKSDCMMELSKCFDACCGDESTDPNAVREYSLNLMRHMQISAIMGQFGQMVNGLLAEL